MPVNTIGLVSVDTLFNEVGAFCDRKSRPSQATCAIDTAGNSKAAEISRCLNIFLWAGEFVSGDENAGKAGPGGIF
ncbi:hypothetical protein [Comamonas sp. MYb396]|uniref:hypothetical protein n=1 Tax=Comamonas sp. MYb396 TaxID=2745302 RepID=UPI0030A4CFAB